MSIVLLNTKIMEKFDKDNIDDIEHLKSIFLLLENKHDLSEEALKHLMEIKDELDKRKTEKITFIAKTNHLIQRYQDILQTQLSYEDRAKFDEEKNQLQCQYFTMAEETLSQRRWADIKIAQKLVSRTKCKFCINDDPNQFEMDDSNKKFCLVCSGQQEMLETTVPYKDSDRSNSVNKYTYSRIIHFQECIKQYQGKQKCKIPEEVFEKLEKKFKALNLLIDSENTNVKYSRITKEHILIFLKQLNYTNHYENANYIYYVLVGKRDDIEYLEEQLIKDFKDLSFLYDLVYGKDKPKELKRKCFMNAQYILFQLLQNRSHPCRLEDFSVLKTIDKKRFYDDICSHLFAKLGWNFTPTF